MNNAEIRKDYFLKKYVIIAPARAKRPKELKEIATEKNSEICVFCPENIDPKSVLDKIGAGEKWQVLSLENVYPAVSLNNKKAYGTQEVIIETPKHDISLANLPEEHVEKVLKMYAKRTAAISKNKKIDYILCFKNQGPRAGASLKHAHSQVFATQILPPDIQEENKIVQEYKKEKNTCPYCDVIRKEVDSKREIYKDKHVFAFTPFASRYQYEAWIFTRRHLDNITKLTEEEFRSFAKVLKRILLKLELLNLPFNFFLHQVVSEKDQHFYLKIEPRGSIWAGIELGSGLIINPVFPEDAAEFLKK